MLRNILSITGKPGLFKIVSHSNKMLIVEELGSGKRFPASSRDKVVSLGDIAMYTLSEDKPLGEIFSLVYSSCNGEKIDVKGLVKDGKLREKFEAILPDYDKERVYPTDIKKLFTWYNILVENGYKDFSKKEDDLTAVDEAQAEEAEAAN